MVRTAKEYIAAGDIYQVVLSQRFETPIDADPFTVYRALRHVNPSPYMYFLRLGGRSIVGSSPEMLVRVEGQQRADAPDCRHAPARPQRGRGHAAGRGAEAQREGARRARDARRSRAQRHRPRGRRTARCGCRPTWRSSATRTSCTWSRSSRASSTRTTIGSTRSSPASRRAPSRARRRCGRWRSSPSSRTGGAASTPAPSGISTSPATSISASRSAPS